MDFVIVVFVDTVGLLCVRLKLSCTDPLAVRVRVPVIGSATLEVLLTVKLKIGIMNVDELKLILGALVIISLILAPTG